MIGYKPAIFDNSFRVVITLEIPDDAITNVNRKGIVNKDTAKYHTKQAKVIKIEDDRGREYPEAVSGIRYGEKRSTFKVNTFIDESHFDSDYEEPSEGCTFFLTKRVAEFYELYRLENGLLESWHENGQKYEECNFVKGKLEGICMGWHENGQKSFEFTYTKGQQNGLNTEWDDKGRKISEIIYKDGIPQRPY